MIDPEWPSNNPNVQPSKNAPQRLFFCMFFYPPFLVIDPILLSPYILYHKTLPAPMIRNNHFIFPFLFFSFHDNGLTHATAAAKRSQTSLQTAFFHLMDQADHDPAAGIADRVSEGDSPPIHIDNLPVQF
jgi:hypothetical protein